MELKPSKFGFAVGSAMAAAFTVCAFFVAVAPDATAAMLGYLLHIDLSLLTRSLTWASYIAGVFSVAIWAGLWAAAAAKIYNLVVS